MGIETTFSFGLDNNGVFHTTPVDKTGTCSSSKAKISDPGFTVEGVWHYHNNISCGGFGIPKDAPSIGDIYTLNSSYKANPNIKYFLIGSETGTYMAYIANPAKLDNFVNNYMIYGGGGWIGNSAIEFAFDNANASFTKEGNDVQEAYALAQAAVLSQFDSGVILSKIDDKGNFTTYFITNKPYKDKQRGAVYSQAKGC